MGQKAKNAGKKQSKICDKLANTKSIKFTGRGLCKILVYEDNIEGQQLLYEKINKLEKKQHRPMTWCIDYNVNNVK